MRKTEGKKNINVNSQISSPPGIYSLLSVSIEQVSWKEENHKELWGRLGIYKIVLLGN